MWFESAQVELVRDAFPEWMALLFAFLSHLGSVWFVAPVVVLAYWFHDRHRFASWIGIVMGGYAVMVGFKGIFEIPRPGVGPAIAPEALPLVVALLYAPAVEVHTTSFPSGHALAAVVVWTMLALEFEWRTGSNDREAERRGLPGWQPGVRGRRLLVIATMVALVSFARVGAGVHFPIDVLVGALVGVGYVTLMLFARERLRRRRGAHVATTATFAIAGLLSLLAFLASGTPDAMALFGGCLGGFIVWQMATPRRRPWPVTGRVVLHAFGGIALLALAASTLIVVDSVLVWFAVGLVGGLVVVGLPRVTAVSTAETAVAGVSS